MDQKFSWKKEYEIGIPEIDAEHQIFLKIIQKIDNAFSGQFAKEFTPLLIKELYKYADFHFISEENFMLFYKYPEYEDHKKEHQRLLGELNQIISFFSFEYSDQKELISFLFKWFKEHTITLDFEFGRYIKNNNLER